MAFLNVLRGLSHFILAIPVFNFPKTRLGLSLAAALLEGLFHHSPVAWSGR
jgi:hypothetical protein